MNLFYFGIVSDYMFAMLLTVITIPPLYYLDISIN